MRRNSGARRRGSQAGFRAADFLFSEDDKKAGKRQEEELFRHLAGTTIVLDARFGGLSHDGLLDDSENSLREHSTDQ